MKIIVDMSDINNNKEISITDGAVTYRIRNEFMLNKDDLHGWITRAFDIWVTLYKNQKRASEEEKEILRCKDCKYWGGGFLKDKMFCEYPIIAKQVNKKSFIYKLNLITFKSSQF